jgi:hypothetical protein
MAHRHDPPTSDERDDLAYDDRPSYVEETEVVERPTRWYDLDLPGRVNSILIEALLVTRFLLVLFGANRTSGFVDFVLDVSWPFVRPFDGAFNDRTWEEGVIEVSTLLAMLVWAIVFSLAAMLVNAILSGMREGAAVEGGHVRRRRVHRSTH